MSQGQLRNEDQCVSTETHLMLSILRRNSFSLNSCNHVDRCSLKYINQIMTSQFIQSEKTAPKCFPVV